MLIRLGFRQIALSSVSDEQVRTCADFEAMHGTYNHDEKTADLAHCPQHLVERVIHPDYVEAVCQRANKADRLTSAAEGEGITMHSDT